MSGAVYLRCGWLAAIAIAVAAGAEARASAPACSAESWVEPSRVVPGQQVLYRVQIASRDDVELVEWLAQPSFPGVRTETLPGFPLPSRERDGRPYAIREEQRAVFAEAPGRIVLRSE